VLASVSGAARPGPVMATEPGVLVTVNHVSWMPSSAGFIW
jgi:hypothetical protein